MTDYTAKIKGKGLDGTGFTEELAASLFNRVGHHMLAIVEVQVVDKHGPNLKGQRGIELVITSIEPAEDSNLEDHLRELTRTLHYNRGLDGHTGTTTEGQERTVADVMASGQQYRPHPFLPDDAAKDTPICDVCGGIEASAVHSRQDVLDDPDTEREDETEDAADPYDFVHAKGGSLPGEETLCALHATTLKSLHTHDDHDQVTCPTCREQLDIDASFHGDNDEPWDYPAPEPLNREELEDLALTSQSENGEQIPIRDPFTTPTA